MKEIIKTVTKPPVHWVGDGLPVQQMIDYNSLGEQLNPFVMLDYGAKHYFEPHEKQLGVGFHPHRGFETVSVIFEGEIAHRDSEGNGGLIKSGDVQWMTAGSGIQHEELHSRDFTANGGNLEMFQLWFNLHAKNKNSKPKYQNLHKASIPTVSIPSGSVRIIAGEYNGEKGPASTFSPVNLLDIHLNASTTTQFEVPDGWVGALLVRRGNAEVNGQHVENTSFVAFGRKGQAVEISTSADSDVVLMAAEPIDEPVTARGPFVMNTPEEISVAYKEYLDGKYGGLPM